MAGETTTYYRITLYYEDGICHYRLNDEWVNDDGAAIAEFMADDSFVSVTFEDGAVALVERIGTFRKVA